MNILIAGASGFIGRELVKALQNEHQLTVLGRHSKQLTDCFPPTIKTCTWDTLSTLEAKQVEVVINLCGSNIGASRWNPKIKQELIDSRVKTCSDLVNWAVNQNAKPHFFCANAVGIYGMQKNGDPQSFDENSTISWNNPPDFLAEIGVKWQKAIDQALDQGMKVTTTRFGVALKKGEGMLKKLAPSFYLGLGAVVGDGQQVLSWIHIDDIVGAYQFLLKRLDLEGAFNLTAPQPVNQAEFAQTMAKTLHRPLFLKLPAPIIRGLFGEMGECLLLKGQRVLPKRLIEEGYHFRYPDLKSALEKEFG